MGMKVGGSSANWAPQASSVNNWQSKQQGLKDLFSALKAGDLPSAQKAMASVGGNGNAASAKGPLAQIASALQSGDLAGAQKAAEAMQSSHASHRHHQAMPVQAANTNSAPSALAGLGSQINTMA